MAKPVGHVGGGQEGAHRQPPAELRFRIVVGDDDFPLIGAAGDKGAADEENETRETDNVNGEREPGPFQAIERSEDQVIQRPDEDDVEGDHNEESPDGGGSDLGESTHDLREIGASNSGRDRLLRIFVCRLPGLLDGNLKEFRPETRGPLPFEDRLARGVKRDEGRASAVESGVDQEGNAVLLRSHFPPTRLRSKQLNATRGRPPDVGKTFESRQPLRVAALAELDREKLLDDRAGDSHVIRSGDDQVAPGGDPGGERVELCGGGGVRAMAIQPDKRVERTVSPPVVGKPFRRDPAEPESAQRQPGRTIGADDRDEFLLRMDESREKLRAAQDLFRLAVDGERPDPGAIVLGRRQGE